MMMAIGRVQGGKTTLRIELTRATHSSYGLREGQHVAVLPMHSVRSAITDRHRAEVLRTLLTVMREDRSLPVAKLRERYEHYAEHDVTSGRLLGLLRMMNKHGFVQIHDRKPQLYQLTAAGTWLRDILRASPVLSPNDRKDMEEIVAARRAGSSNGDDNG